MLLFSVNTGRLHVILRVYFWPLLYMASQRAWVEEHVLDFEHPYTHFEKQRYFQACWQRVSLFKLRL